MPRPSLPWILLTACALSACSAPDLAARAKPTGGDLWIAGADVVDVLTGSVARARDVRIEGRLIAEIVPAGAAPPTAIDGRGATLVPGFIDAHVHIGTSADPIWEGSLPEPARNLQRLLYCGVTTVFETGGSVPTAFELRDDVASGEVLGPRIFTVGPVFTAPKGHPVPMLEHGLPDLLEWYFIPRLTREVASPDEARAAVDGLVPLAPDAIKLVLDQIPAGIPSLSREVARAIATRAREQGLRTVAHIGTATDAIDAAEAGAAAWIHGVYRAVLTDAEIARLAAYRIPMVPTLVVFESYGAVGQGPRASTALERETVAAELLRSREEPPADLDLPQPMTDHLEMLRRFEEASIDNVRRLHAAGVVMLAGSDSQSFVYHGPGLHRELALLARALPPLEVLRAATVNAARFLTQQDDPPFGVIAPGKEADLVLVEGDPLKSVGALSEIRAVIADGVRIERTPVAAR